MYIVSRWPETFISFGLGVLKSSSEDGGCQGFGMIGYILHGCLDLMRE